MKSFAAFALLLVVLLAALLDSAVAAPKADCEVGGEKANKGEKFQVKGECNQYTCHGPGDISAVTCPVVAAPPTCKHTPQDNSKPYPMCCESYDC